MSSSAESRLAARGVTLPSVSVPAGSYVPWVRSDKLLFVSGQIPIDQAGHLVAGRVPDDVTVEAARDAARLAGLRLLAAVRDALGSLDDVARVVKINAYVNGAPGFADHPGVINGCSDLMLDVFGERGRHARAAVGAGSLPMNACVEVEGTFEAFGD